MKADEVGREYVENGRLLPWNRLAYSSKFISAAVKHNRISPSK